MGDKGLPKYQIEEGSKISATKNSDPPITFEHPIFCFKYLHKDYSLSGCGDSERLALINQVVALSQLTWQEIQLSPKHGMGSEKISIKSIKPKLPINFTGDVDHLIALRFDGKKPMVGHRNKCVFHIFYLDTKFSVYNHN